jgi:predicted nucleotidyltransferase
MAERSERERALRDAVEAAAGVDFALLFGSRASGAARPDSDWDLAVHCAEALDADARAELRDRLVAALEPALSVDVVLLNDAAPLLAQRALEGRMLVMRDRKAYVRFFVRTLALAGDEAYYRDLHARARERRLEEGRFGRP